MLNPLQIQGQKLVTASEHLQSNVLHKLYKIVGLIYDEQITKEGPAFGNCS